MAMAVGGVVGAMAGLGGIAGGWRYGRDRKAQSHASACAAIEAARAKRERKAAKRLRDEARRLTGMRR